MLTIRNLIYRLEVNKQFYSIYHSLELGIIIRLTLFKGDDYIITELLFQTSDDLQG